MPPSWLRVVLGVPLVMAVLVGTPFLVVWLVELFQWLFCAGAAGV